MGIKSIFSLGFIALFCVSVTTSGLLDTVTDLVDDVLDDLLGNDYDEPQESQEEPQEPPGICAQLVGHSSLETCVFPTVQDMTTFNKKNYCISEFHTHFNVFLN